MMKHINCPNCGCKLFDGDEGSHIILKCCKCNNLFFVAGISLVTAGMSKYLSIPGITVGSHSWQQVFKSGFTKMLRYGFNMSAKTLAKGAGYLLVSGFTTGFFVGNILQVLLLDRG